MTRLESLRTEMSNLRAVAQLLQEEIEVIEREAGKLSQPGGHVRPGHRADRAPVKASRGKAPRTRLEVRLRGETYSSPCAADTLADVVAAIGPERIEPLRLRLGGRPLVSRTPMADSLGERKRGSWYIHIHSSTADKKAVLEQIGRALGLPIAIRIVP